MTQRKEISRKGAQPPAAWLADFGRHSTMGITFTVTFLVFGYLGYLADGMVGTEPLLLIVGIFMGAALGFIKLYYTVFPLRGDQRQAKRKP